MLTSIFLNGLKLPSFFWYTLLIWDSHMMSPGEIKLALLQKVPFTTCTVQLVSCPGLFLV